MMRDLASCRKCVGAYHAARQADADNYFRRRLFEYYVNRLISSLGKLGNKGAGVILQRVLRSKSLLHEFPEIVHSTSSFRSAINAQYSASAVPLSKATAWRSLARRFYCSKSPTALEHPFLKVISFVTVEYLSSCAVYEPLTRLR